MYLKYRYDLYCERPVPAGDGSITISVGTAG